MELLISVSMDEGGDILKVGVKKVNPEDRLNTSLEFLNVYPPPKVLQAIKEFISQAEREEKF